MGKSIFEQMGGTYTLGEDGMYYRDTREDLYGAGL